MHRIRSISSRVRNEIKVCTQTYTICLLFILPSLSHPQKQRRVSDTFFPRVKESAPTHFYAPLFVGLFRGDLPNFYLRRVKGCVKKMNVLANRGNLGRPQGLSASPTDCPHNTHLKVKPITKLNFDGLNRKCQPHSKILTFHFVAGGSVEINSKFLGRIIFHRPKGA